jgi:hypothetical protein
LLMPRFALSGTALIGVALNWGVAILVFVRHMAAKANA